MIDASLWGVVWAIFAVTAGLSLTVAAKALWRRASNAYFAELDASYNALAPQLR